MTGLAVNGHRIATAAALAVLAAACAARAPAVVVGPDDATCRLVLDTTEQRVHPRFLSGPMPKFPRGLMTSGLQGQVVLQFDLGCNGRVRVPTVQVVSFTRQEFVEPAITAVVKSKFSPALIDGRPVAVRVRQGVRFAIGAPQAVYIR